MPSHRVPRGYGVKRPYYQEICEGVRPTPQAMPLEAWTGLPAMSVDELHHDPIVIEAGTCVGVCPISGSAEAYNAAGYIVPATRATGCTCVAYSDQNTNWGIQETYSIADFGSVKPIGVVFAPTYSFYLQHNFTNYQRSHNVGVVTDYVVEIPAIWSGEHLIEPGDMVAVTEATGYEPNQGFTIAPAGRYEKWEPPTTVSLTIPDAGYTGTVDISNNHSDYVIGRCLKTHKFAYGGTAGEKVSANLADSGFGVYAASKREFGGLEKVQTVPGLGTAGSATKGIPGWLMGARSDSGGFFRSLTILVRL